MNIVQTPDQSQFVKVLIHYKKFYVSLAIICICLTLFIVVIIPQFQQYGQQQVEIEEVENRIKVLQNNISILSRINGEEQNTILKTVLTGLPDDKDYAGVLFAARSASAKTGVGLGDFTFQVGELSQKSVITKNLPVLTLKLHVIGSPAQVARFLKELSQTLPLSNVTEVAISTLSSDITAEFYYKSIPQLQINYTQPVMESTVQSEKVLEGLNNWQKTNASFDSLVPITGSASASPFAL